MLNAQLHIMIFLCTKPIKSSKVLKRRCKPKVFCILKKFEIPRAITPSKIGGQHSSCPHCDFFRTKLQWIPQRFNMTYKDKVFCIKQRTPRAIILYIIGGSIPLVICTAAHCDLSLYQIPSKSLQGFGRCCDNKVFCIKNSYLHTKFHWQPLPTTTTPKSLERVVKTKNFVFLKNQNPVTAPYNKLHIYNVHIVIFPCTTYH
jgi:hypothetical protein